MRPSKFISKYSVYWPHCSELSYTERCYTLSYYWKQESSIIDQKEKSDYIFISFILCSLTSVVWERKRKWLFAGFWGEFFFFLVVLSVCLVCPLSDFKKKILLGIQPLVSTSLCFFFEFSIYRWTSLVTDDHFYTWLFLWFCGFWIEFSSICLVIFVCSSNIFSLNNWKILFKCFSYFEKLIYFYVDWLGEGQHLLHDNHWL